MVGLLCFFLVALFLSLVAIGRILMFLLNAKQMGLVNCLSGQGVRDVVVSDMWVLYVNICNYIGWWEFENAKIRSS